MLPVLAAVAGVGAGVLLVEADRALARAGAAGVPEAVAPLLVALMLASAVLIALLAALGAVLRPTVSALPAPSASRIIAWLVVTVAVAAAGLGSVRFGGAGLPFAPALTATVAALLFAIGLVAFARHARVLAHAARPYAAVAHLGELAVEAADRRYPPRLPAEAPEPPPLRLGRVVPSPRTGYVVHVDGPRLVRDARRANAVVVAPAIGAFVMRGEPLLQVFAQDGKPLPRRIARGVRVAELRDVREDVAFDLGLLSDVAVGAIASEPGVAEAALDRIGEVLGRLGPRPFPHGRFADAKGRLRVVQPVRSWSRLVEIALSDLALRAGADPRVRERLAALIDQLRRRVAPERAAVLAAYAPHPGFTHPVVRRVPVVDLEPSPR
jgi:uncharacterized membrane protein